MNNFNNDEWLSFIKDCESQVKQDNNMGLINSVFLRNPEICPNPQYCLIAMEPLDSDLNELKRKIGLGYRNFVEGYKELLLLYCAYNYLGNKEEFNFYITDLSKGSMTGAHADAEKREDRYARWQGIFKKEMNLLGNPKLIAVGKRVYEFMNSNKSMLKADDYIWHYSNNALTARKKEYDYINNKFAGLLDSYCDEFDEGEFNKWVLEKFMKHLKYKRIYEVELVLSKELTESKRELFALYRHNFESITKNGRVTRGECKENEPNRLAGKAEENNVNDSLKTLMKVGNETLVRFQNVADGRCMLELGKPKKKNGDWSYIHINPKKGCVILKKTGTVFEYHDSHPFGRKQIKLNDLTDVDIKKAIDKTP